MVPGDRKNPDSFKVRRGKVGGFSDYFDKDQMKNIEQMLHKTLQPVYGYTRQVENED
jgi:hypothetical protein